MHMNRVETNKRLESIQILVQEMIISMNSEVQRQQACVHLYGVSNFASLLAKKRKLNNEIAAIIGLLHDYYFYKTGNKEFPGINSADTVRPILRGLNMFTKEELITILQAIFYREDRNRVHDPYEEVLKDAYVMQLSLQNPNCILTEQDAKRLQNVYRELAIPDEFPLEMPSIKESILQITDRRSKMADIAEELAKENIIGVPGD